MSYGLNKDFERSCAALAATSKTFWGRIGSRIQPDELDDPLNKLIVKLARDVAKDHGWPTETEIIQRGAAWMTEGKASEAEVMAVSEALQSRPDVDLERTITELIEPVRKRWQQDLVRRVLDRYKNGSKFSDLVDDMQACDRLGDSIADVDILGTEIGEDTESILERAPTGDHMPTGIAELDSFLEGGPHRGTLTTILGDSKAGKSMALSFFAAVAAMHGENVGYLALEDQDATYHARILAAVTGIPISEIMGNPRALKDAKAIWSKMRASGTVGRIIVNTFGAGTLDADGVLAWFAAKEREKGIRIRFRIVDYGDLIAASGRRDNESKYTHGETVWRKLSNMALGDGDPNWVYTASQSTRPQWKHGQPIPILTRSSVADSMHKVRLSNFFISLTPQPDMTASQGYIWYIDSDRHYGRTGAGTDIVQHQRHLGRMADISHLG